MPGPRATLVLLGALALGPASARAHGPLHEQIDAVTAQLARQPEDPALLVRRGELHQAHGDPQAALADYDRAHAVAPGYPGLDLLKGHALLEVGRPAQARSHLERFLRQSPRSPQAYILLGRVHAALGDHREASRALAMAVAQHPQPTPDEYIELARAQVTAGAPDEALRSLEDGMKRIGRVVTLQLEALAVERRLRRFDQALARIDELTGPAPRKETWLYRRGEVLAEAGRRPEARRAFEETLAAIAALPPHLRATPAMVELEESARAAAAGLQDPPRARPRRPRR